MTIGEGYDGVWLPTIGALQGVDFRLGDPSAKSESFRYNLATSTAVVPSGVRRGDTYSFTAVQPADELTEETLASTALSAAPAGTGFLKEPATDWAEKASTPMGRVLAIAEHLKSEGKYSDGVTKAEQVYHPGHNLLRLSDEFINDQQMVGNDEQYAAVMALLANEVGVPARVVLGAVVPDDGVVTGEDVQAWVELRAADGSWRTLPHRAVHVQRAAGRAAARDQHPDERHRRAPAGADPAAVGRRRPERRRPEGAQGHARTRTRRTSLGRAHPGLGGLRRASTSVARSCSWPRSSPRSSASRCCGVVGDAAPPIVSARFVGAWRELVDHARDLGQPVPARTDRHPPRAVGLDRVGVGAGAGPPGRQLRLRAERSRSGCRGDLLGVGRVGAQGDVALGGSPSPLAGRDQRGIAATWQDDAVGCQSAGPQPVPGTEPQAPDAPTPAPEPARTARLPRRAPRGKRRSS